MRADLVSKSDGLGRRAINAVCVKAQRGTSIDCVQNISNRQMIAIDGQCMVNGHLCSIVKVALTLTLTTCAPLSRWPSQLLCVCRAQSPSPFAACTASHHAARVILLLLQDHAGVMADKGNQQPGAPAYKYPMDAVLHIIDNRSHTQQKSARSQSFSTEVESNLLSRGVFGSTRDRTQFKDPMDLMNPQACVHSQSHFQNLSQTEEMVALKEAFKVTPIKHTADGSDEEDTGRGWCRPSQPDEGDLEIDDRGDLVPKKQCIIA